MSPASSRWPGGHPKPFQCVEGIGSTATVNARTYSVLARVSAAGSRAPATSVCKVAAAARLRLRLNDGSCVRLRTGRVDNVWSYDFVHHRTHDGRAFRTLNVLDEFTRESLVIRVQRKLSSTDVIDVLTDLFILRGIPAYVRSDNGPEFVAGAVRQWTAAVGARTGFIEPGSPWENG